jgi:hypothetical protein
MEMFDLRGDCRPGHFGESAIDERESGNKPPKGDEVKRKIDMGLHKIRVRSCLGRKRASVR